MAHSYCNLLSHVIFSTKERAPMLDVDLRQRLFPYMGGIIREIDGNALIINGPSDHDHALLALPATLSIADAMRLMKTNSSRWVHETWPERSAFAWQTGYAAFGVSESNRESVRTYIANQELHHRTMTFQDEFIHLLRKHGVDYDERYIWQ